jgi:hypothetical protein
MLLITNFVELHMVAGRSRTQAGCPHAVSGWPVLIHACHAHATLCCGLEKSLSEWHGCGMAWHGRGMARVTQARPHCVNQMGKTRSKPLVARHGRGPAWERHDMRELALYPGRCLCGAGIVFLWDFLPHISLFVATIQKTTIQMLMPMETSNIRSEFFYEDIRAGCYECFWMYSVYCECYLYSYSCGRWVLHSWEKWFSMVSFLVVVDDW